MARRIRWQIIVAFLSTLAIVVLLGHMALSTASEGNPQLGGTYTEGLVVNSRSLRINPLRNAAASQAEGDISSLIFEGLTRPAVNGRALPVLVEDGWDESADGTVYTFTLKSGIIWHDGQPLTSQDVVFSYRMLGNPDFHRLLGDQEQAQDQRLLAVWRNVIVEALDERRVRFKLAQSFAPFLSHTSTGIIPAHLFPNGAESDPAAWQRFERQPIGTGPYKLVSLSENAAELESFPAYHDPEPVKSLLDHVVFRFYDSPEAAQAALGRREIQGLGYTLTEQGELPLPARHTRYRAPLADYTLLTFNLRRAPLDSLELRKALAHGLDKDLLLRSALPDQAMRLDTPILSSSWATDRLLSWYLPDQDQARTLLQQAGWQPGADGLLQKGGQPLRLPLITTSARDRLLVAEEIRRQYRALGIEIEIQQVSAQELSQRLRSHDFTMAVHSWLRLGSDPDLYELWHSSQIERSNYAGLTDQGLDGLIASARRTSDLSKRAELYQDALKKWVDLAPSIILYQPFYEQIVSREVVVAGLSTSDILYSPEDRFRRLTKWGIATTRQVRSDLRNQPEERPR